MLMNAMNQTNQTEEELEALFSCDNPSVHGYHFFAVVWGSLVSVTGTVGNLMTILAFATNSQLRTRFNVLIINLAAADLLYCALLQPISVDSYLHLRWRSGALWCRIFGLLLLISNGVSIITLCLIAVSRYLLVARKSLFHLVFSNRGLVLLLTFTWSFVLASFGPLWSVYVFVPKVCTCSFHRTRGRPYTSILLFFYFFVGLLCVGVFYLLIYRHVRISAKALRRYRLSRRSSRKKPVVTLVEYGTDCSAATGSCRVEWSSQTDLGRTKLDQTNHQLTKQDRTDLDQTEQGQTDLDRTKLDQTKQEQTDLNQTKLDGTKLGRANVGWTKLDRTDRDQTEKDRTDLDQTDLCQTDPGQTNLNRTTLDWTNQVQNEQDRTNMDRTDLGQATADNHAEKQVTPAATVVSSTAPPSTAPPAAASSHSATPADNSDVKRVTRMCFMVFLCFVFCFLPFLLINVLDKHNTAPLVLHMVCANLTWLNSCINPLLYAVMNRQFRQAYRVLLTTAATPFTCLWARC